MNKVFFICLIILLTILSTAAASKVRQSDPELIPYVQQFAIESKGLYTKNKILSKIPINFHDFDEDSTTVGTCNYRPLTNNFILINKAWWFSDYLMYYEKLEVVFHELGHCLLNRSHTSPKNKVSNFSEWWENLLFKLKILESKGRFADYCPKSIMHPYTISHRCMAKHYKSYMKELFGGK